MKGKKIRQITFSIKSFCKLDAGVVLFIKIIEVITQGLKKGPLVTTDIVNVILYLYECYQMSYKYQTTQYCLMRETK